ncbi:hypothetical protein STANM309S_01865 [Streptomyces tanashiensis]
MTGTGVLTRLALRRDRLTLPVWALVAGGMVASGAGCPGGAVRHGRRGGPRPPPR